MKRLFLAALISSFAFGPAFAQDSCETKAVDKAGKPLVGAAKTSFMAKCKRDACASQALDKNGKALAGAAKTSFLQKCEKGG